MDLIPYYLEAGEFPGLYKTRPWNTYREPTALEIIQVRVNSTVEFADYILEARRNLPPETLKTRLDKTRFKLNYHFKRIFK